MIDINHEMQNQLVKNALEEIEGTWLQGESIR